MSSQYNLFGGLKESHLQSKKSIIHEIDIPEKELIFKTSKTKKSKKMEKSQYKRKSFSISRVSSSKKITASQDMETYKNVSLPIKYIKKYPTTDDESKYEATELTKKNMPDYISYCKKKPSNFIMSDIPNEIFYSFADAMP
jgi:hypothetical protein